MPARPTPQCCPPQRHGPSVDRAHRMPVAGWRLQAGSGPQAVVLQPQAAGQGDSRELPLLTSGELAWHGSSTGAPGAAEGPQRPSALTNETSDSVQIGDKGLEQGRTGEKKPHDSNVYSPASAIPGLLCHRFGH